MMVLSAAQFRSVLHMTRGYFSLLRYTSRNLRVLRIPPVAEVFHRQVYFTGIQALRTAAVLALLCGVLVVTQVTTLVGGDSELTVKVLIWTIVRELGSLLAAVIVIARSSAAIASELALMKVHNELDCLAQLRIPPVDYLIVPRIAGVTLAVIALSIYFQAFAVGGGLAISALFQNISFTDQLGNFLQVVGVGEFFVVIGKGAIFGMVIAAISCYHGINTELSATGVPKAAAKAVIQCLMFVFLLDAFAAYLYWIF